MIFVAICAVGAVIRGVVMINRKTRTTFRENCVNASHVTNEIHRFIIGIYFVYMFGVALLVNINLYCHLLTL
jgi:hypothetical protein